MDGLVRAIAAVQPPEVNMPTLIVYETAACRRSFFCWLILVQERWLSGTECEKSVHLLYYRVARLRAPDKKDHSTLVEDLCSTTAERREC